MTGLDCSQPPEGVAETMLPQRSTMSRWQVSPRAACAALASAAIPDAANGAPNVGSPPPAIARTRCRRAPQSRRRAAPPRNRPGPEVLARARADEGAPGLGILPAQQLTQRYVRFIAVPRVAIGHDELDRLRHEMHELGAVRIKITDAIRLQNAQRLQHRRPLAPRAAFVEHLIAILDADRLLDRRSPAVQIRRANQAAMMSPGHIERLGGAAEPIDGGGYRAFIPVVECGLDLRPSIARGGLGLREDGRVESAQGGIGEQRPGRRHGTVLQEYGRGAVPLGHEQIAHRGDGVDSPGQQRMALQCVVDGGPKNAAQGQRAPIAQQREPRAEGSRYAGGEQARARNEIETERCEGLERGGRRRAALAADHGRLGIIVARQQNGHIAPRPVQMRLDDLQHETGRRRRVKRIAAGLQHFHAAGRRDPVGGGDGPENPGQLRSRGEDFHQRGVKSTPKVRITWRSCSSGCGERLGERQAT